MSIFHRVVLLLFAASLSATALEGQQLEKLQAGVRPNSGLEGTQGAFIPLRGDCAGTYWKEGARILGIPAAIAMYRFSNADDGDAPGGTPVRDGLVAGLIGGALGGLIGFFIPKR